MQIQENVSLKAFNTFGIDAHARYFVEINNKNELRGSPIRQPISHDQKVDFRRGFQCAFHQRL